MICSFPLSDTSVKYEVSKTFRKIMRIGWTSDTSVIYEVSKAFFSHRICFTSSDTPVKYEVSKASNNIKLDPLYITLAS